MEQLIIGTQRACFRTLIAAAIKLVISNGYETNGLARFVRLFCTLTQILGRKLYSTKLFKQPASGMPWTNLARFFLG